MPTSESGYDVTNMFAEINAEFLKQWKEFPGTNTLKYSFVIIGLLCWLEYFIPDLKFASYYLTILLKSTENIIIWFFGLIIIAGLFACSFLWLPSYLWIFLKRLKNR